MPLDIYKRYSVPDNIKIVRYRDSILVISVLTANWLVLKNEEQLRFFELLKTMQLSEALINFKGDLNDAKEVVLQLEGKNFENTERTRTNSNGMHFYLTNGCNMKCKHCYMSAGHRSDNELSTEEVLNVLKSYREYNGAEVTFSGGEITTRKDIIPIIKYASEIGLSVNLYTNGVLFTKSLIEQIAPFVNKIQVSIDGFSEEENSKLRGRGNFSKALHAIELMLEAEIQTDMAITPLLDDALADNIDSYVAFANEQKKHFEGKPFEVFFTSELLDGRDLKFSADQKAEYSRIMDEVSYKFTGVNTKEQAFVGGLLSNQIFDNCNFGCLSIGAEGDVYMCSRIPDLVAIGNIRTHSFDYIMNQAKAAQKLSDIKNFKPCNECELMYICGGNCRIEFFPNFTRKSDYTSIDMSCIPQRYCDQETKDSFYDLMIRTNKEFINF